MKKVCIKNPKGLNRNEYVYYSPEYPERLHIYHLDIDEQEEYYIYEPINVNETREEFMQKYNINGTASSLMQ